MLTNFMTRRGLAVSLIGLTMLAGSAMPGRAAAPVDGARAFITELATETVEILKATQPGSPEREAGFAKLLRAGFDLPYLAQLAIGREWRTMSDAEKQRFIEAFTEWVVKTQSVRLGQYAGEQFNVTGAQPSGNTDVLVATQIAGGKLTQPVQVDWRVRERSDGFKIIDTVIAGVSMVLTYRGDFQPILQRGGVDALIAELRQRAGSA